MSEDTRNRLGHGNMTKIITFFIIGFSILGPIECLSLPDPESLEWWATALFYEVPWRFEGSYSFRNFGDVTVAIDSLKKLGVDALCLRTIFPWANQVDSITDYTDVNKALGTMADIERLIAYAHLKGIKVILDVVPFYTSDQHPWFRHWEENRNIYNEFYITAPNDGSDSELYTLSVKRQKNYWHLAGKNSPTLSIRNQAVRSQLNNDIFTFWLDEGVDGFRITGLSSLFRDTPTYSNNETALQAAEKYLKEVREHVDKWTKDHNSTSKYLAVETPATVKQSFDYYGPSDSPGVVPLNEVLLSINSKSTYDTNATSVNNLIMSTFRPEPQYKSIGWMLSHRDYPRLSSRVGERKAGALTMLMMLLPGHVYMLAADDKNVGDSTETNEINPIPGPSRYTCIFARIVALRKLPIFTHGDFYLSALNDGAVLELFRWMSNGELYVALINLADTEQKINLTETVNPSDFEDPLEIVVNTDTTISGAQYRDSVHVPPNAGIVLRSVGIKPESFIDKTVEKEFCEEPDKNNSVPMGSTDKTTKTGENEPSGEDKEKKHAETGGKGERPEPSQPGKNETTETYIDVVSPKGEGDATTEKPKISRGNGPSGEGDEKKHAETGGKGETPEPSQPGKNETTETDMNVVSPKPKGDATTEKPKISGENGPGGEDKEKKHAETGGKGETPESSQPGKNETTETDMNVVSPKPKGDATTEKPKIRGPIDQGRGDEEHRSVGKGGKETNKSGYDAAANGKKDEKVDERVEDDTKGKGKEVNKDEVHVGDEKTTGWGASKRAGTLWRSIAQSFTRYWRKKLEAVSRRKIYRWNRQ